MTKHKLYGVLYSINNFSTISELIEKYNIESVRLTSSFDLLEYVVRNKPDFVLIDQNTSLPETIRIAIEDNVFRKSDIRFISVNDNTKYNVSGYLMRSDYDLFFVSVLRNKILTKFKQYNVNTNTISLLLKELRFPTRLLGYNYLRECITVIINNGGMINSLKDDVYPLVARKYNKNIGSAQRCISRMIENCYNTDTKLLWSEILRADELKYTCPTAKEMITLITDKLITDCQ